MCHNSSHLQWSLNTGLVVEVAVDVSLLRIDFKVCKIGMEVMTFVFTDYLKHTFKRCGN